jgi:hypothetical protein
MATSDLNIVVKAKNEASKVLKDVKADISGVEKAAGLLSGGLAGVAAVAGIGAFTQLTQQIGDLVQQSVRLDLLRKSFDNLAQSVGASSDSMLDSLRLASFGMIADSDLMLSANKAMMLGVADNTEEMIALLDVARVRGQAMGLGVTEAFNDIVTGLGRESALILDNLGITIDLDRMYKEYAGSLGKTVSALSAVERKQALVNEVMRQSRSMDMSAPTGTAAALAQAQVAQQAAALEVGAFFAPGWRDNAQAQVDALDQLRGKYDEYAVKVREVGDIVTDQRFGLLAPLDGTQVNRFTELRAAMTEVGTAMSEGVPAASQYATALQDIADRALKTQEITAQQANTVRLAASGIQAEKAAYDALRASLDQLDPKLDNIRASAENAAQGETRVYTEAEKAAAALRNAAYAIPPFVSGLSQIQAQAGATAGIIYNLAGAINSLNGLSAARPDALDSVLGQINGITSGLVDNLGIDAAIAKGDELKVQARERAEVLRALGYDEQYITIALQAQVAETQTWAGELDKVATQSVPAISAEFSNLKSTVEGVLSGAFAETAGVDLSGILPREDAVAENARRLADIAKNGLKGQDWLSEFAATAPGAYADLMLKIAAGADAKTAAAQILSDFNAGLRTDLIDRETAKEQVRRMILGEANMAALAAEIAQELATEMGIPLQEAMAAAGAALGVPTAGAGGATAGAEGAAGATPPDMTSSGASAGTTFVTGFQTTATGTLLVATIVSQMTSAILSFQSPGQLAGKTWGGGFMSTVETSIAQPLISLLVTLVTPGVIAQLATAESQTTPP